MRCGLDGFHIFVIESGDLERLYITLGNEGIYRITEEYLIALGDLIKSLCFVISLTTFQTC